MGYQEIENLYKCRDILLFKECYATEKIHGSSFHILFKDNTLHFFAGGEKEENFRKMFDVPSLIEKFKLLNITYPITVYGEGYGGKMQAMSKSYGKVLKFIAFEVKVGERWLSVPDAEQIVLQLGLEFVHYRKIPTTLETIDAEILLDSEQAIRNGMGPGHKREGVVLRPLIEVYKNNGARIIAKHKRTDFSETKNTRPLNIDPKHLEILDDAEKIAEEWVTNMRLAHVLQTIQEPHDLTKCGEVCKAMIEDVFKEAKGEIVESKECLQACRKTIGKKTIALYKEQITKI
jgi:hypothetical protein